ncbi:MULTISPECIES: hypothetical protein [unclassified Bradyrhizobium]
MDFFAVLGKAADPSLRRGLARMDEEALIGLENIKQNVEKRFAKAGQA